MNRAAAAHPRPAHLKDPWVLLATGFGSGLLRPAPGTWGSLLALVIWFYLLAPLSPIKQGIVIALISLLGLVSCRRCQARYGWHDPGSIVIDEWAGLWLALIGFGPSWPWALAGFGLFRLFDILKPWPVSWADRLPGPTGVMLDDLLAGSLAAFVLQFAFWMAVFFAPSLLA